MRFVPRITWLDVGYGLLLFGLSPWLIYASLRFRKYRSGWSEKFLGQVPRLPHKNHRVWFHAVSVGEVNLLRPLLDRVYRSHPGIDIVISATTQTGYKLARQKYPDHTVFYCPLDFSWAVARALQRIQPSLLVLVELELWPQLLAAAQQSDIPVAVVNGRMSDRSFRGYWRFRRLMSPIFRSLDLVAAHDAESAARFRQLGVAAELVVAVGSIKFDGARTDREAQPVQHIIRELGIEPTDIVFIAGSTQSPEEEMVLRAFAELSTTPAGDDSRARLVLVPRHPERAPEVMRLLSQQTLSWQQRSAMQSGDRWHSTILLVDTIGELSSLWGRGDIGFVGGSFGSRGGQNMIEPAGFGVATCFGPNTRNFRDVVSLLMQHQAAVRVTSEAELLDFFRQCLLDVQYRHQLGDRARQVVRGQCGAADATLEHLLPLLNNGAIASQSPLRTTPNSLATSSRRRSA